MKNFNLLKNCTNLLIPVGIFIIIMNLLGKITFGDTVIALILIVLIMLIA